MRRLRLSPWKPSLQWGDEGWRRGGESPLGTRMSSSLQLVCARNRNLSLAHSSPSIQVGKPVSEPPEIPGIPSMGVESTLFWLHFWKAFISQVFGSIREIEVSFAICEFVTTWMNREDFVLSELSQMEKDKYRQILYEPTYMGKLKKKKKRKEKSNA